MKRKAVAAFALLGIYQLIPAELVGATPRTMDCKVESIFRGHPTIRQMRDGEARMDCATAGKQRFHFSADDRGQMEIAHALREGDTYRLTLNGSRVENAEVLTAVTRTRFQSVAKRPQASTEVASTNFTVTYPCASFERQGLPFPANGEARYPLGCNVVAELEKDSAAERAALLALAAKNEAAKIEADKAARLAAQEAQRAKAPARPHNEFAALTEAVRTQPLPKPKKAPTIKSNWMGFIITYN